MGDVWQVTLQSKACEKDKNEIMILDGQWMETSLQSNDYAKPGGKEKEERTTIQKRSKTKEDNWFVGGWTRQDGQTIQIM